MDMKQKQEYVNKAYEGIIAQGGPSTHFYEDPGNYQCAYRGDSGRKCHVGLFIPDSVYTPSMEGSTISEFSGYNKSFEDKALDKILSIKSYEDLRFWYDLQRVHDESVHETDSDFMARYPIAMDDFCLEHALVSPVKA